MRFAFQHLRPIKYVLLFKVSLFCRQNVVTDLAWGNAWKMSVNVITIYYKEKNKINMNVITNGNTNGRTSFIISKVYATPNTCENLINLVYSYNYRTKFKFFSSKKVLVMKRELNFVQFYINLDDNEKFILFQ